MSANFDLISLTLNPQEEKVRGRIRYTGAAVTAAVLGFALAGAVPRTAVAAGEQVEYSVLAKDGVPASAALAAIREAGGTVLARNDEVGLFRVAAPADGFAARAAASTGLVGAARVSPIGRSPQQLTPFTRPADIEQEGLEAALAGTAAKAATTGGAAANRHGRPKAGMDPLDDLLWGLTMVRSDLARRVNAGDRRVSVGILDTGMDASHPDIAPNFSWSLSRNFAPDIPEADGACEVPSCLDPVGTDDNGHGTHTSGTVGAAANGLGVSGVAPKVTLVELKGGQDSGLFFLEPVVNALTYAGNAGIDVVNMSFFLDPWLYNCVANPADSPEAQLEQRINIVAMSRALTYAHLRGVTLFGSLGNNHEDLGNPRQDITSPDYPPNSAYPRTIDNNTCLDLPVEGPFVIGVSALGPSTTKSDFSNYGTERISVSAPGGWFRDFFGTPQHRVNGNQILSTYPLRILQARGLVDAAGEITPAGAGLVFRDCTASGTCGYYTYLQGTSMASPHAVGVAALIVSRFGQPDRRHPGTLGLDPRKTEAVLLNTAAEHACPEPRLQTYTNEGRSDEWNALCVGDSGFNGFYGHGIVDAYAAVTARHPFGF
jgi:subtilisin family serine protease